MFMKKVLVTGGAGYIGSALAAELLKKGRKVIVFDSFMYGREPLNIASALAAGKPLVEALKEESFPLHENLEVAEGDIRDKEALDKAFRGCDTVVHLAAIVGYPSCKRNEQAAVEINYFGTRNVVEMAGKHKVRRAVFASSYSNYGISKEGMADEDSRLYPQSLYAETKIACERLFLNSPVPSVILRFATVFGLSPRSRFDLMIPQFIIEAMRDKRLLVYQGEQTRSFIHVNDIVRSIVSGIEAPEGRVAGHVFNVGDSSLNYRKGDVAKEIGGELDAEVVLVDQPPIDGDMRSIECSFGKIKAALGFEKSVGVKDSVKNAVEVLEKGAIEDPFSDKYREREGEAVLSAEEGKMLKEEMASLLG